MTSTKAFWAALACALSEPAFSASLVFDWNKTAFTAGYEGASDVGVDADGNVYWGYARPKSNNNGGAYYVTKFRPDGAAIWSKEYASQDSRTDMAVSIAVDPSGNVAICKAAPIAFSDGKALWSGGFGKLNSAGSVLFSAFDQYSSYWNYTILPYKASASIDHKGNCVFAFPFNEFKWNGQSFIGVDGEAAILKTTPTGGFSWFKKIIGPGLNLPTGLAVDASDNVYAVGYSDGQMAFDATTLNSNGGQDGFIAKYDQLGTLVWVTRPTCSNADTINSVTVANDGTIWFSGTYYGSLTFGNTINATGFGAFGNYIARIGTNGVPISVANLADIHEVKRLAMTPAGKMLATGTFSGTSLLGATVPNRGSSDVFLAEVNSAGNSEWSKTLGYLYADAAGGFAIAKSGEIYLTADVNSGVVLDDQFISGASSQDVVLVKLVDPSASQLPVIVSQPTGAVSYFGSKATFSIQATNALPVTYQWFRNGEAIIRQTAATLNLPSVSLLDDANYYVEVRNQYGVVRSESARLLVRGEVPVMVTTIAGTNVAGFVDSASGALARLSRPNSFAIQNDGVIVFPDSANLAVRVLEPGGGVGTIAGKGPTSAGFSNGPASSALFALPLGVCVDSAWDMFVADANNHAIRKISSFGARMVTTYAGTGEEGFQDGPAAQAKFQFPNDLVADPSGNLFVTEFRGHRVRQITRAGVVTTFAGNGTRGHRDGPAAQAMFSDPSGIARDATGNLYITEWGNDDIRKITPEGIVSTIAGKPGQRGFVDGPGLDGALLGAPDGITMDVQGNIFFTEFTNNSVRRLDPNGEVITLVGAAGQGFKDGNRAEAKMNQPGGIAAHPDGSLIVADSYNNAIRRVVWQTPSAPTEAAILIELNPSITIFGVAGKTYRIESAENLLTGPWVILGEVTLLSTVETWFDSQPATRSQRYYRAILK